MVTDQAAADRHARSRCAHLCRRDRADLQLHRLAGAFLEEAVDFVAAANFAAIDGEQIVAFLRTFTPGSVSGARRPGFQFSPK